MNGDTQRQLPQYQSHKKVWALKIKSITLETDGSATITPEDLGYAPFKVTDSYVRKHNPQPGGYYVRYKDGYESWSPERAFEDGYTRVL